MGVRWESMPYTGLLSSRKWKGSREDNMWNAEVYPLLSFLSRTEVLSEYFFFSRGYIKFAICGTPTLDSCARTPIKVFWKKLAHINSLQSSGFHGHLEAVGSRVIMYIKLEEWCFWKDEIKPDSFPGATIIDNREGYEFLLEMVILHSFVNQ